MSNYTVLRQRGSPRQFEHHTDAFQWCDAQPIRVKGVYKNLDDNTLGALNIFGKPSSVYTMECNHKQYTFKVI